MTKIHSLRSLLPCFYPSPTNNSSGATTNAEQRLSTSLRHDTQEILKIENSKRSYTGELHNVNSCSSPDGDSSITSTSDWDTLSSTLQRIIPTRASRSMVVCTFYGARRCRVWFCVQMDRLSTKPTLLLELSLTTQNLVREMRSGLVRIALECSSSDVGLCPLRSVPVWIMYCNGRRIGSAARRKASEETRLMLKKMQNMTVGAGVIKLQSSIGPSGTKSGTGTDTDTKCESGSGQVGRRRVDQEVMYMRANYEWLVGGDDSESFHLINPDDDCPGQDLSIFLLRST